MESDAEFLFRFAMDFDFGESEDLARLFALARRGVKAADRIEQLEAVLLTGVCMLSEMGLDPREKCQMAYDYMSAALGEERKC